MSYKFNPFTGQFDLVGASSGFAILGDSSIIRYFTSSFSILAGYTRLLRSPRLAPGVTMTIEPDGEAYIL